MRDRETANIACRGMRGMKLAAGEYFGAAAETPSAIICAAALRHGGLPIVPIIAAVAS